MRILRLLPRFKAAERRLQVLAERECYSRESMVAFQLERLNSLWKSAHRHVEYYSQLKQAHLLPDSFHSWEEFDATMPILDKRLVRDAPKRFLSSQAGHGRWMRTGGSTGIPMQVFWETEAHREMLACKYRGEQAWGLDVLDRKALLWGHRNSSAPGLRGKFDRAVEPLMDWLRRRARFSAYQLGPQDIETHLRGMLRFQPASIYGYSTAVTLLARYAEASGMQLPNLRLAILTGEPADSKMISDTERGLSTSVAVEYGSCECGLLAYRYPDSRMLVRDDVVRLETKPRPDGRYDIIVTVLNNAAFPLMRYAIEDITTAPLQQHPVGLSEISGVLGRGNDVLISRAGRVVHSMAVKHAIENHPLVRRFHAIQHPSGDLTVDVEMLAGSVADLDGPRERLLELLEGFDVELRPVATVPISPAGKHRWIVCNYEPNCEQHVGSPTSSTNISGHLPAHA